MYIFNYGILEINFYIYGFIMSKRVKLIYPKVLDELYNLTVQDSESGDTVILVNSYRTCVYTFKVIDVSVNHLVYTVRVPYIYWLLLLLIILLAFCLRYFVC